MSTVAISTIAFEGQSISEIIKVALEQQLYLEFSSGLPYDPNAVCKIVEARIQKIIHNYFPAPLEPFVLNLASASDRIRTRSIEFCINNLHLTKKIDAPFYSAHAGFCGDPDPMSLGGKLNLQNSKSRQIHWELFLDSVQRILTSAVALGVGFLIENNVIAKINMASDINPLLCCEAPEILRLADELNTVNFGVLLDTGHWKVSGTTLGFSIAAEMKTLSSVVRCLHHSDNDGNTDSNDPLDRNYWFLEHVEYFNKCLHVLEVKNRSIEELRSQLEILENQ